MKKIRPILKYTAALSILTVLVLLAGCKGGPPSALERRLFNTETQYVPHVIVQTNIEWFTNVQPIITPVPHYLVVTNAGIPSLSTNWYFSTNYEAFVVAGTTFITQTNIEERHIFSVKPETQEAVSAVGTVVNSFVPGLGGLIGIALTGAAGIYARLRSRKANEALVQGVQTGREIINAISTDPSIDRAYKDWLEKHQKELGVFTLVSGLVEKFRDKPAAKEDARAIVSETSPLTPSPQFPPPRNV